MKLKFESNLDPEVVLGDHFKHKKLLVPTNVMKIEQEMKRIRKIDDENYLNIELSQLKDEESDQLRNNLFK